MQLNVASMSVILALWPEMLVWRGAAEAQILARSSELNVESSFHIVIEGLFFKTNSVNSKMVVAILLLSSAPAGLEKCLDDDVSFCHLKIFCRFHRVFELL